MTTPSDTKNVFFGPKASVGRCPHSSVIGMCCPKEACQNTFSGHSPGYAQGVRRQVNNIYNQQWLPSYFGAINNIFAERHCCKNDRGSLLAVCKIVSMTRPAITRLIQNIKGFKLF